MMIIRFVMQNVITAKTIKKLESSFVKEIPVKACTIFNGNKVKQATADSDIVITCPGVTQYPITPLRQHISNQSLSAQQ